MQRLAQSWIQAARVPLKPRAFHSSSMYNRMMTTRSPSHFMLALFVFGSVFSAYHALEQGTTECIQGATECEALNRKVTTGDVLNFGVTKEPATGILFPRLCNGLTFVGCGVRVKFGFVKVYAVGTYVDPIAMDAVKKQGPEAIKKALLDPMYPRTIRIVMNRAVSIDKFTAAIIEAITPRMQGEDMDKIEEFKALNPKVDLIEGAEIEMTIRGNTMLYKNSLGSVGQIHSPVFCRAMCDVYYGNDSVSPGHKDDVVKGVSKL